MNKRIYMHKKQAEKNIKTTTNISSILNSNRDPFDWLYRR